MPIRKTLASYNIYSASSSNCATGWAIQGSNDGTNWTNLDTQSGVSAWTGWKATDFSISSPGAYFYYRLKILAVTGSYAMITSIKLLDAAGWKLSIVGEGTDPNYFTWNGEKLNIKGDIVLGYGDNAIHFEDSLIDLIDGGHADTEHWVAFEYAPTGEWFASFLYANEPTSCKANLSLRSNYYNGETIEGRAYFELRTYARADPNKDYIWLRWFAGMTSSSWYYYDDGSFDIYGSISFKDYIKFGIPTWYGTKTTAINKYPSSWTDWTDPEDCPHSNMWIWLKTAGTPAYVLYFKTPHDSGSYSYWVALNRVAP